MPTLAQIMAWCQIGIIWISDGPIYWQTWCVNTLRPRQNGRRFADDSFKCLFWNENRWISTKISLKFVPNGPINDIPALVQIMAAWHRPGDKPLSEPMLVSFLTHICITRPQWVKGMTYVDVRVVSFAVPLAWQNPPLRPWVAPTCLAPTALIGPWCLLT